MSSYLPKGVEAYADIVPAKDTVSLLIPILTVPLSETTEVDNPLTNTLSLSRRSKPFSA